MFLRFAFSLVLVGFSNHASAEQVIAKSANEVCVMPTEAPIEGADYSKRDKKQETKLCAYDFHTEQSSEAVQAVALCPKMFSTNPAIELLEIPANENKTNIEAKSCNETVGAKNKKYKKLAKYKQSMSCSKTPSIIGYYHISRALGLDIVPVSVLRTMEKSRHQKVAEQGVAFSKKNQGDLISKNWNSLLSMIKKSDSAIFTDDGKFSIGALSENPRGEQKYYEDFYPNASGLDGVKNFKSTKLYQKLTLNKPVSSIVGSDLTTANFTAIRQMKDATDMIIMDTLFGQQDRFGNVHSIHTFMTRTPEGLDVLTMKDVEELVETEGTDQEKKDLAKAKDMPSDWKKEITARNALLLKVAKSYFDRKQIAYAHSQELLLKDNDCGLKSSNVFKSVGLIDGVRHISESTFVQLAKLNKKVSAGEVDGYLGETLYMDSDEATQFKAGLAHVTSQLRAKCKAGQLHLDLNVKAHLLGNNQPSASCDQL